MYTTYAQQWFVDAVNWNTKQTKAFDALPGRMRKLLTRLDSSHYTATLERMLREKGVDIEALQSEYKYSKVKMDGDAKNAGHAF
jgi:hypothetical protein